MRDKKAEQQAAERTAIAVRAFAEENRVTSWHHLWSTMAAIFAALTLAALVPWWPLRLAASVAGGLLMARGFILFHDFMHGSILKHSIIAKAVLYAYGLLLLTAPSTWRASHNYHHANVGKIIGSQIGSFPIMTIEMWRKASPMKRAYYRVARHPITILFSYLTIFFYSNTLETFLKHPRKHWDAGLAIVVHGGVVAALWSLWGFAMALYVLVLPFAIAAALGAYLFYAQHNFKGMYILPLDEWSNPLASLKSCSYMKLGRIMRWITGNIGYHHIHHLNLAIPFYRLPEAMNAVPETQHPVVTTLSPQDIRDCFRLKLWDEREERMVSYKEAGALLRLRGAERESALRDSITVAAAASLLFKRESEPRGSNGA